jgi:erythromycin esterase-like protein
MKIYKWLFLFMSSLSFYGAAGQADIKSYVESNIHVIRNIDPDSLDFSDLEAIGDAIGNARIVMLGEQDHGDAPAFLAKARLIKYLHEKKGFNVLAFESDFFGLNYQWPQAMKGQVSFDSCILYNIFAVWTMCRQCQPFFQHYLPGVGQPTPPLTITGFDMNMGSRLIFSLLDSVIRRLDLPISHRSDYSTVIYPSLQYWYKDADDSVKMRVAADRLADIRSEMLTRLDKGDLWIQTMDNLIGMCNKYYWKGNYWKGMNLRDAHMAASLKWLAYTKFAKDKIIVWAHNYHVSKYGGHYPEDYMNEGISMTTLFTQDPVAMAETYVIGFTGYEGRAGRLMQKQYTIQRPPSNSFENWGLVPHPYAFVDFGAYNREHPGEGALFNMSASVRTPMLHTNSAARWNKVFDGVFFIKETYPCEPGHR